MAAWLNGKAGKRAANLKRSGAMGIMIVGGALPSGIQMLEKLCFYAAQSEINVETKT